VSTAIGLILGGSLWLMARQDGQLSTRRWLLQGERGVFPSQTGCTHEDRKGRLACAGALIDTRSLCSDGSCFYFGFMVYACTSRRI